MDTQKISKILNLIEIAENNLKTAQFLIRQLHVDSGGASYSSHSSSNNLNTVSSDQEQNSLEVIEGNFEGENMIGDDGKIYAVPANYASKTKLVVGDRMKRILTDNYREVYKVIQKVASKRVVGTFAMDENGEFVVMVDSVPVPIRVLKASITFAMKQQNLRTGDTVAILVPASTPSTWGAFDSIVKHQGDTSQHFSSNDTPYTYGPIDETTSGSQTAANKAHRPSLDQLKEGLRENQQSSLNAVPTSASMPNPFDSLDEFKM